MRHEHAADDVKKRAAIDPGHASQSSKKRTEPAVQRNVRAIVDLERKALEDRAHISRLSENATKIAGSPAFIVAHLAFFVGWMVLATTRFAIAHTAFDVLNMILTLEALVLTCIVLIAQRDLKRLTDLRGHLDLQVNLLAEQELTAILGLLDQICDRLGIDSKKTEPQVEELSKDTDVRTIANALEKNLDE